MRPATCFSSSARALLTGAIPRGRVLGTLTPLMFASYFGLLSVVIAFLPGPFDWRYRSISVLLSPKADSAHVLPALGIVVTGLLAVGYAGYLARLLRHAAPFGAGLGAVALDGGALLLIGAAVVVPHYAGDGALVPRLHDWLAGGAGMGIAVGMLAFYSCVLKNASVAAPAWQRRSRALAAVWSFLILPTVATVLAGQCVRVGLRWHLPRFTTIYHAVHRTMIWQLGFWEWVGSALVFGLFASAAIFLPEHLELLEDRPARAPHHRSSTTRLLPAREVAITGGAGEGSAR